MDIAMVTGNMDMVELLIQLGGFQGDYVATVRDTYVKEKVPMPKVQDEIEAETDTPDGASNQPDGGASNTVMCVKLKEYQGE